MLAVRHILLAAEGVYQRLGRGVPTLVHGFYFLFKITLTLQIGVGDDDVFSFQRVPPCQMAIISDFNLHIISQLQNPVKSFCPLHLAKSCRLYNDV